jgi:DNA topoisomerase-1
MIQEKDNDPNVSDARSAGLRYITDSIPGITRKKKGKSFQYFDPSGKKITDEKTLLRIKKLVLPPAWKNIWINPHANGHLQATGRDVKGRKQYKYHQSWREIRDGNKYEKLISFAETLPGIREKTEEHLRLPGLPKEKVTAIVVRLLELTCIRIGNEEYAKQNQSFGLTTFHDQHVEISGSKVTFEFKGKSGKMHSIGLQDKRLAALIKKCRDIPGHELFQYIDENNSRQSIGSADVNEYLKQISGREITAKDFRTWAGTVHLASVLCTYDDCDSETKIKKNLKEAIVEVSRKLGNTPAICRKCYIHPVIFDLYSNQLLRKALSRKQKNKPKDVYALSEEESAVLEILRSAEKLLKSVA